MKRQLVVHPSIRLQTKENECFEGWVEGLGVQIVRNNVHGEHIDEVDVPRICII